MVSTLALVKKYYEQENGIKPSKKEKLSGFLAILSLPKMRHTVCQLSGVSTRFQVYRPCLHLAHRNTHVNGANFVINSLKSSVNTFKTQSSIQTRIHRGKCRFA